TQTVATLRAGHVWTIRTTLQVLPFAAVIARSRAPANRQPLEVKRWLSASVRYQCLLPSPSVCLSLAARLIFARTAKHNNSYPTSASPTLHSTMLRGTARSFALKFLGNMRTAAPKLFRHTPTGACV